LQFKNF